MFPQPCIAHNPRWPFLSAGVQTFETPRIVHWHIEPDIFFSAIHNALPSQLSSTAHKQEKLGQNTSIAAENDRFFASACDHDLIWLHAIKNRTLFQQVWNCIPREAERPPRKFAPTVQLPMRVGSTTPEKGGTLLCELSCDEDAN